MYTNITSGGGLAVHVTNPALISQHTPDDALSTANPWEQGQV